MARKHNKHGRIDDDDTPESDVPAEPTLCWLCARPTGKTVIWHHPVPKSRGGRDTVPMHPICQQMLTVNFTNSELQRHGLDASGLLADPAVRKFVDWVANKDPDFSATLSKKKRLMSVAFRRDGDEEHLEPKFELPIPIGPNLVTARGLKLIEDRIAELRTAIAKSQDPADATSLERDLRYWQTRQVTAELAPLPSGEKVEFGTEVVFSLNGKTRTLRIVGDDEASPADGLISFNAPLSRAMLGAEPGDTLPFGGIDDAIEIVSVARPVG